MKRIICIILSVCMIFSIVLFTVSCDQNTTTKEESKKPIETQTNIDTEKETEQTNANTVSSVTETEQDETTKTPEQDGRQKMSGYEDVDFGGRTFYIASSTHDPENYFNDYIDFWAESYTGDAINDAVYDRNQIIQKLYNCKIEVTQGAASGFTEDIATGAGKYIGYSTAYSLAGRVSSTYYNVLKFDCDFDAEYFDQAFIRDLSYNDKLFSIVGSWSLQAKESTWIIFYNKAVYESKFSDIDIYQMVRDHKWTYDALMDFISKIKNDTNGDQAYTFSQGTDADILGFTTTSHQNYALYYCGGLRVVDKDPNGNFVPAFSQNKNASEVIDKMIATYNTEGYIKTGYTNVRIAIQNGTTLFAGETMDVLNRMTSVENLRIGVLPQPLFNEEQESYYHYVNNQAPLLGFPTSFSDIQILSDFLSVWAYHSHKIVLPAFLNTYKYTYASDEQSAEMVELIINSLTYDPGYHLNFGTGFIGAVDAMLDGNKNQYAQAVARQTKPIENAIETFVNKINAVDDSY